MTARRFRLNLPASFDDLDTIRMRACAHYHCETGDLHIKVDKSFLVVEFHPYARQTHKDMYELLKGMTLPVRKLPTELTPSGASGHAASLALRRMVRFGVLQATQTKKKQHGGTVTVWRIERLIPEAEWPQYGMP